MLEERPIVIAAHPNLIEEFKIRKKIIEDETSRKNRGGLTVISEMAAMELKMIRMSGDKIYNEILKIKSPIIKQFSEEPNNCYVPYELYKKLYILSSTLYKKKDQQQINVEISKIKGLKKNEVKCFW